MIAQGTKCHRNFLVNLYNWARKAKEMADKGTDDEHAIEGLAIAELVMFIEHAPIDGNIAPVFKPADLAQFYTSMMKQLGVLNDGRVSFLYYTTNKRQLV